MVTYRVMGTNTPRVDGVDKVTGARRYAADYALPGTLWGKVLHSPYAHARIVRIDASAARKVPGRARRAHRRRRPTASTAALVRDIPVLAVDRVRFVGERVAAVAADDEDIAQQALDLIEVEYEELPAVFDPDEAMAAGAPVLHPDFNSLRRRRPAAGDAVQRLQPPASRTAATSKPGSPRPTSIVENTYTTQRVHQAYLEPQSVLVVDRADRVHVWACSKAPYNTRDPLAAAVGISPASIVLQPRLHRRRLRRQGRRPSTCRSATTWRRRRGRPVRMVADYLEEFMAGNPRHATAHPPADRRQKRRHDHRAPRAVHRQLRRLRRLQAARRHRRRHAGGRALPHRQRARRVHARLHEHGAGRPHARARRAPGRLRPRVAHRRDRARPRHGPARASA